ncbi:MAG TPA: hypothetical protein DHV14_08700 [Micrococcales bacterium]|uniref:VanZ family protein n=1 Tax=Miniimonas arenae TaxID=676201 RepID=UPI000EE084AD|nr:VanZ family protein [Miniimonas arenae]HCX85198.1 hypothetical protein [Micrococcales bacterium]
MSDQVLSAAVAVGLGLLLAVVGFVPFVAIAYRRGRLTWGRGVLWTAALVYGMAIWTYTLLPLPDPGSYRCAGVNTDPGTIVTDVTGALSRGHPLTDPALLQLVLNVVLFVPLGFLVRVLAGRGIGVAFLVGLGTSLLIETTQLTGVWGIYPCAYRVFDVVDLMTNTTGALVGSLLALAVPAWLRDRRAVVDVREPAPVTRGRRLLAMLCDVLGATFAQLGIAIVVQVALLQLGRRDLLDSGLASDVSLAVVIAGWLVVTLATGRTVGDLSVELAFAPGPRRSGRGRLPVLIVRVLRFVGGIGGYLLLGLLPDGYDWASLVFAVGSLVLALRTTAGRGLPGLVSGQHVVDARDRGTGVGSRGTGGARGADGGAGGGTPHGATPGGSRVR